MTPDGGAARTSLDALPLRDDLRGSTPYGAPQLNVPWVLNTNENPYPLPADLLASIAAAVTRVAPTLHRYPDREAVALRTELAGYLGHGLRVGEVWAANGSNEIQQQLMQAFAGAGRTVLGFTPSYSMHPLLAVGTGSRFVDGHRGTDFGLTPEHVAAQVESIAPDVVILCSPNNPTGTALDLDVVRAALRAAPGMVIVDEAYAEFARPATVSAIALLPESPQLVVSRTMSKAFGMAGLRVGYLAASSAVVDAVQLVRLPYHLSSLTQAVARAALAHATELLATVEQIKVQRDRIVRELTALDLRCAPSDANFVFFGGFGDAGGIGGSDDRGDSGRARSGARDSGRVWQALLDRGVLIRDVGVPGWLRVTAGTEQETTAFLDAIRAVLADRPALVGN